MELLVPKPTAKLLSKYYKTDDGSSFFLRYLTNWRRTLILKYTKHLRNCYAIDIVILKERVLWSVAQTVLCLLRE